MIDFETFCSDPQLLGEPISKAWATFYAAVEGLPLDAEGAELFRLCTGRASYEPRNYAEATAICGRRSEKTSTGLKYLVWKALTAGYENQVHRAGMLRIPICAQDLRVARDIKRTAEALVLNSPMLKNEVAEIFSSEIQFRNDVALTCYPATWRSTRGLTVPAALLDELAFVVVEGASDVELVRQVRPAMVQFGDARRLIKLSTPWQKSGLIFEEFSRRNERTDLLVWQASTSVMTPRIPAEWLERERAADPTYFAREFLAEFTDDLESFLPSADIDAAVVSGLREAPPIESRAYVAALDASSLTGRDRFAFGIAHLAASNANGRGIALDLLRGWTREPVPQVCDEIAGLCKAYGLRSVVADQHGFHFLRELMAARGIELRQLPFTVRSKSDLFLNLKLDFAQGRLKLLDNPELLRELRMLESKRTSGGNYQIAAPRGQHDDFCCALVLLAHEGKHPSSGGLVVLSVNGKRYDFSSGDPQQVSRVYGGGRRFGGGR